MRMNWNRDSRRRGRRPRPPGIFRLEAAPQAHRTGATCTIAGQVNSLAGSLGNEDKKP
jgi:hypothetical protein